VRQKGFAPIIIVLVLALLGSLGYIAYLRGYLSFHIPNKTIITPTSYPIETKTSSGTMPTENPAANWKTYTNDQYHFSFKYPEWVILDDKSVAGTAQVLLIAQGFNETKISARKDDQSEYYLDTAPVGRAVIGNLSGNKYRLPQGYCDGPECSSPILAVTVVNNGIKYIFSVYVGKDVNTFTELESQILSTFEFTQ